MQRAQLRPGENYAMAIDDEILRLHAPSIGAENAQSRRAEAKLSLGI
jgi:hypothetical protein